MDPNCYEMRRSFNTSAPTTPDQRPHAHSTTSGQQSQNSGGSSLLGSYDSSSHGHARLSFSSRTSLDVDNGEPFHPGISRAGNSARTSPWARNPFLNVSSGLETVSFTGNGVLRSCFLCGALNIAPPSKLADADHDPGTRVCGPLPNEIRSLLGGRPEWTLCNYYCRSCRNRFQMYRYHLVSFDCYAYTLNVVEARIQSLALMMSQAFERPASIDTSILSPPTGRVRQFNPTQNHSGTVAPNPLAEALEYHPSSSSGVTAQVPKQAHMLQQTQQPLVNSPNSLEYRRGENTNPITVNGYTPPRRGLPPLAPSNTSTGLPPPGSSSGRQGAGHKRNMNYDDYREARRRGACLYHKQKHAKCKCRSQNQASQSTDAGEADAFDDGAIAGLTGFEMSTDPQPGAMGDDGTQPYVDPSATYSGGHGWSNN